MKSMTAFGRSANKEFEVEIVGVNRRHFELDFRGPRGLAWAESEVRQWVGAKVARGHVVVNLYVRPGGKKVELEPHVEMARGLKEGWKKIADALGVPFDFHLDMLLSEADSLFIEKKGSEASSLVSLKEVMEQALNAFDAMRLHEGSVLKKDLMARLEAVGAALKKIDRLKEGAPTVYREKLLARLHEVLGSRVEDERVLKEVALFAERVDIAEEVVRAGSHLGQLKSVFEGKGQVQGKRCEFLLQELNREFNTIGSKTVQSEVSSLVIDAKCELERMREQVQNIE